MNPQYFVWWEWNWADTLGIKWSDFKAKSLMEIPGKEPSITRKELKSCNVSRCLEITNVHLTELQQGITGVFGENVQPGNCWDCPRYNGKDDWNKSHPVLNFLQVGHLGVCKGCGHIEVFAVIFGKWNSPLDSYRLQNCGIIFYPCGVGPKYRVSVILWRHHVMAEGSSKKSMESEKYGSVILMQIETLQWLLWH